MGILIEENRYCDDFITEQAYAFWDYFAKDAQQAFEVWADSKEFGLRDKEFIYREVIRIAKGESWDSISQR